MLFRFQKNNKIDNNNKTQQAEQGSAGLTADFFELDAQAMQFISGGTGGPTDGPIIGG